MLQASRLVNGIYISLLSELSELNQQFGAEGTRDVPSYSCQPSALPQLLSLLVSNELPQGTKHLWNAASSLTRKFPSWLI